MSILGKLEEKIWAPKKKEKEYVAPRVYNISTFYEVETIARDLLKESSVIVNVNGLSLSDRYRVVDFLSGVNYVLRGKRMKLDHNIYLFTSSRVRVTGASEG